MPSQIAHILVGRAALSSLPAGWSERLDDAAFRLGCQGPDVFYHNRRTKPGAFLYGTRLHRRGWGTSLSHLRSEALRRSWPPEHPGMSFLIGQASHGFLDRAAHPFVVSYSGWRAPGKPETEPLRHAHAFLERILDSQMWTLSTGTALADCRWQNDLPSPEDFPPDFWEAWGHSLHAVFPQLSAREDLELRLQNAVSDTRGFLEFTAPGKLENARRAAQHGALHYFHPINLPDWDFLNLEHRPWPDPLTGTDRRESFVDLAEVAIDQTREALATLTDPRDDWESRLGNGSLNLPGAEGRSEAPSYSQPWDYPLLFEREVRARGTVPAPRE